MNICALWSSGYPFALVLARQPLDDQQFFKSLFRKQGVIIWMLCVGYVEPSYVQRLSIPFVQLPEGLGPPPSVFPGEQVPLSVD